MITIKTFGEKIWIYCQGKESHCMMVNSQEHTNSNYAYNLQHNLKIHEIKMDRYKRR